ncbi:lipase family protein [Nocardia fluminea]|uniref:Triacylglycerol lipase n=1 Tax=Nocardia fluminea TaxID=134984 RepID=A0A2N3V6A4_9NOCA|nr:lipase family protein [Nocardia fluminea]PKV77148.1 triacylglycerol lipase [Nocardia fluminea]
MTMVFAPVSAAPYVGPVQPPPPFLSAPQLPELDPFYHPPSDAIAAIQPGDIIAARAVTVANFSLVPVNVDAWQVSYRSNDGFDQPVAAVATVIKPRGEVAPGTRNLLSYQMAEDSTGQYCASSYAIQQWSMPAVLTGQWVAPAGFIEAQIALQQGWAVVIPDHQGPNAAFADGPMAGRITLDGIRAAENFAPLGLDSDTKVGMWGYSGGSIPTMHAAELRKTYAPELNIVGATAGGVDADLGELVELGNNAATSGLMLAGIIGLSHGDPRFRAFLAQNLNPLGQTLLTAKDRLCTAYQSVIFPFLNLKGLLNVPGDLFDHPEVRRVIERTRMGKSVPDMPVQLYQANMDWVVPVGPVNALYGTYCQDPAATVTYIRDNLSEHLSMEVLGIPTAIMWLRDRFDAVAPEQGCHLHDVGSIALDQRTWSEWVSIVGETAAGLTGRPLGS